MLECFSVSSSFSASCIIIKGQRRPGAIDEDLQGQIQELRKGGGEGAQFITFV